MELLYFVDRNLTRLLQAYSQFLRSKVGLDNTFQGALQGFLAGMIVSLLSQFSLISKEPNPLFFLVMLLVPLFIIWKLVHPLVKGLLWKLHRFFDEEGALSTDKIYDNGETAWALVIIGIGITFGICLNPQMRFAQPLLQTGCMCLTLFSYISFISRKKGDNNRRKRRVTEALKDLLERCKSWLPAPRQPKLT